MENLISSLMQSALNEFNKENYCNAEIQLKKIIELEPLNRDALSTLGHIAFTNGRIRQAIEYFEKAAKDTDDTKFLFNYASVLLEIGHYSKALQIFNKIVTNIPDHIPTLVKCIAILGKMGELTVAERMCSHALKLDPTNSDVYCNLGNIYKDQGNIEEALSYYRKALSLAPKNSIAASNLLLCLNYSNNNPQKVFNEHREWERRFRQTSIITETTIGKIASKKPKLNIGYLSADFRIHSVGYFIEPIIKNHNKSKFNIFCYADVAAPDAITEDIRQCCTEWRQIYNSPDSEIISMIKNDNIDILVDLAGHSGDNKLTVFLSKPVPIQVTYLGYPNTTGLSTMDYRFTDRWADPPFTDVFYTEKLWRLPKGFLSYKPPENVPDIIEIPVVKNSYVTFGSFNNIAKISPETISTWSEILSSVPNSKLIIKAKPFNDLNILNTYKKKFISQKIDQDRLLFKGHSLTMKEHLDTYNHIDIALDTFPYNGTTTTCEALLMGTPVITLMGDRHAGRVGNSLLNLIGLPKLIAQDMENYKEIAFSLSDDINYLTELTQTLRTRFLQSNLCDGKTFTKFLESAYLKMWEYYCSNNTIIK